MKRFGILVMMCVLVLCSGCMTSGGQWGQGGGLWSTGAGSAEINDPSRRVDPGQIAARDPGPYGAALGIGNIQDPAARNDAKEALQTVSENQNMFWGGSRSGQLPNGKAPAVAGSTNAFGKLINSFDYPINVVVKGAGSGQSFGPGQEVELLLPHGRYTVALYNSAGNLIGQEQIDTSRRTRRGDVVYDFYVRLDGH